MFTPCYVQIHSTHTLTTHHRTVGPRHTHTYTYTRLCVAGLRTCLRTVVCARQDRARTERREGVREGETKWWVGGKEGVGGWDEEKGGARERKTEKREANERAGARAQESEQERERERESEKEIDKRRARARERERARPCGTTRQHEDGHPRRSGGRAACGSCR